MVSDVAGAAVLPLTRNAAWLAAWDPRMTASSLGVTRLSEAVPVSRPVNLTVTGAPAFTDTQLPAV